MKIIPSIFDSGVMAAQSTRLGGVSNHPFNSLNLGKSTSDLHENVIQNRKLFFDSLNIPIDRIALSKQVHGTQVLLVNKPIITEGYDAMITNTKNIFLAVSVADCTPILIYDTKNKVVAAIHAGWRGTVAGIVSNALDAMKTNFNSSGNDCFAFIGACIGYDAFEVGEEVAHAFAPEFKKTGSNGKYLVDLKGTNKAQLQNFGIPSSNIEISGLCTVQNNDTLFSHRHEKGVTGRMMAVIGMPDQAMSR
jgi:polyphenol oxidase